MWILFQAFVNIWAWISTRLFKKNTQTADVEKAAGSRTDIRPRRVRSRYQQQSVEMFQSDLQSLYQRDAAMLQRYNICITRKYHGLRRGTVGPIEDDTYHVASLSRPRQPRRQPRKHSAKYRLRQGEYIDNWDCELSELYGKKSPTQPSIPSPLLSGFSPRVAGEDIKEETYRFPGKGPKFSSPPAVSTSKLLGSPFLTSSESQSPKHSPLLTQFADLTQIITMSDFKPVGYSANPPSAVSDTFWDVPAVMPAKPPRVLGAAYDQPDTLVASSSMTYSIWSLPSFGPHDLVCEARE